MQGGKREGSGRKSTGRTTGVISLRVPSDVRDLYEYMTDADKRSLASLVASRVRYRNERRRQAAQAQTPNPGENE